MIYTNEMFSQSPSQGRTCHDRCNRTITVVSWVKKKDIRCNGPYGLCITVAPLSLYIYIVGWHSVTPLKVFKFEQGARLLPGEYPYLRMPYVGTMDWVSRRWYHHQVPQCVPCHRGTCPWIPIGTINLLRSPHMREDHHDDHWNGIFVIVLHLNARRNRSCSASTRHMLLLPIGKKNFLAIPDRSDQRWERGRCKSHGQPARHLKFWN